ncbi:hypothetical protein [Methanococcus maripaludis]|uniref:Uncharacterized protein n=1 Tax=Methanococcus maripaludis TaxID=39152 RepID=A0A7J9PCR1_METMI|nr:hypothetical protein [Methanococcus maripaludis]MBA2860506.1 hypothetical protein [Methanococcus maripaludis]
MATDFFKNLKVDTWYMVFVYLGGILLIFAMFIKTQWLTNKQLIFLSTGMLFVGLGEWKNHKWMSYYKPPNVYTGPTALVQTKIRSSDGLGNFLDILGCIFGILVLLI